MRALRLTDARPGPRRSLRERQKAATRDLILEAVGRCLKDVGISELGFARIAAEAGVTERTIYRHFPSREALFDAWWTSHQASIGQGPYPESAADLVAAARTVFPQLDEQAEVVRGALLSPQGRAIGMRANDARVAAFRRAVRDGAGELREPHFTRLCAAVQALYSAGTWLSMREVWGLSGKVSGEAVAEAIDVLLSNARRKSRKPRRRSKT